MNYNPYYFTPYIGAVPARTGLIKGLFGGVRSINWSGILGGTQKVLNIANQAIPVIKQVSPMMQNAKTMFKVMNEFKKVDIKDNITTNTNIVENKDNNIINTDKEIIEKISNEGPTFFI